MSDMSEKKKALLAQKERLLQEISYYEKEIEDARSNGKKCHVDEDSSDSDTEFSIQINTGPTVMELNREQLMLQTCLQATQELTSLEVLQSEVNIVVDEPTIVGFVLISQLDGGAQTQAVDAVDVEPPITEAGVWREVTAECCVDLVPFSITFYTHTPDRKFAPTYYRGLRVVPVKTAHEVELVKSVLPGLVRPSDAFEVLRSYAAAHRSRRTTLARLADKFAAALYMEPMAEGGYKLKCANLMEVSWTLQNKWSPIAPFHHRMKFDLEYMDESYIKTIQLAHRQLADPSMDTAERTQILAKIISTCLEAQGPTQELYESMSSDPETAKIEKRRTTLDKEPEMPVMVKNKKDNEVMAPPKSIPKKGKKGVKRSVSNEGNGKRLKTDDNLNVEISESQHENGNKEVQKKNSEANSIASEKNAKSTNGEIRSKKDADNVASAKINKTTGSENVKKRGDKDVENAKKDGPKTGKISNNTDKMKRKIDGDEKGVAKPKIRKTSADTEKIKKNQVGTENNVASSKNTKTSSVTDKIKNIVEVTKETNDKIAKKTVAKVKNGDQNEIQKKKAENNSENSDKHKEKVTKTVVGKNDITKTTEPESAGRETKKVVTAKNTLKSKDSVTVKNKQTINNVENHTETKKQANKIDNPAAEKVKKVASEKTVTKPTNNNLENHSKTKKQANKVDNPTAEKVKKFASEKIVTKPNNNNVENHSKTKKQANKVDNPTAEKVKKVASEKTVTKPTNNNVEKHTETKKQSNKVENPTAEKIKKVASEKPNVVTNNLPDKVTKVAESGKNNQTKAVKKVVNTQNVPLEKQTKMKTNPLKTMNKQKLSAGNIKKASSIGNTEKENQLKTKIPLKKLPSISEGYFKKNPLRISPRKLVTKGKMSPKFLTNSKKTIQKPNTNIPRLMGKPKAKV